MFLSDESFEKIYEEFGSKTDIKKASEFTEGVCAIADGLFQGDKIPFFGEKANLIEFRSGEVTIVAGASGHGKSAFVGQVGLSLASQGEKVCIMSFEMKPERTLYRMCRQVLGADVTAEKAEELLYSLGDSIQLLDKVGGVTAKLVYGATIKATTQLGCKHIIIDNLMKCVNEYGDGANEQQKQFVDTLCALAKACDCHIWLVCHIRKGQKELDKADKYAIRGAAAITDQADNVIIFIRNLEKEKKQEQGFSYQVDNDEADNILVVDKQRNGDWQGQVLLWFNRHSYCFCPSPERSNPKFNF